MGISKGVLVGVRGFSSKSHLYHVCKGLGTNLSRRPFDLKWNLRWCYKCWKLNPGHIKWDCPEAEFKCGYCSAAHDVQDCPHCETKLGGHGSINARGRHDSAKCPNCDGPHPAWQARSCNNLEIEKIYKEVDRQRNFDPFWAHNIPGRETRTETKDRRELYRMIQKLKDLDHHEAQDAGKRLNATMSPARRQEQEVPPAPQRTGIGEMFEEARSRKMNTVREVPLAGSSGSTKETPIVLDDDDDIEMGG